MGRGRHIADHLSIYRIKGRIRQARWTTVERVADPHVPGTAHVIAQYGLERVTGTTVVAHDEPKVELVSAWRELFRQLVDRGDIWPPAVRSSTRVSRSGRWPDRPVDLAPDDRVEGEETEPPDPSSEDPLID